MTVYQILRDESGAELKKLLVITNIAAVANALILANINSAARSSDPTDLRAFFAFLLLTLLFVVCTRHANRRMAILVEAALHRIRVRVGRKLLVAELAALEQIRAAEICDRITENMSFISNRARTFASILQSVMIVVFLGAYIAWMCLPALSLLALIVAIGLGLFMTMRREFIRVVRRSSSLRVDFFDLLSDLLTGFKQLKFSRQASREIRADIVGTSESVRACGIESGRLLADSSILSTGIVFAMLAGVVFALPGSVAIDSSTLAALIVATIFLRGPVLVLSNGVLPIIRCNFALSEIGALERKLEAAARDLRPAQEAEQPWTEQLETITTRELEYSYAGFDDQAGFSIGPLNLHFGAGEIVFIVGGNGSGKSTLFKVIAGLYTPTRGQVEADGVAIDTDNLVAYRENISAVFTDFHLFERLYGLPDANPAAVNTLLKRMRLDGVTSYVDGAFTRLDLSTGQRKRLAMVVALLEDRAVYLFDEWAADQDPQFRKFFYEELIPQLRESGKIVIAISHDDRYFERADQVVVLESGQLRSIAAGGNPL